MWAWEQPWSEPFEAAARLAGMGTLAFLDSGQRQPGLGRGSLGRYSYVAADPFGRFQVRDGVAFWNGQREDGPPLAALRQRLAQFASPTLPDLPPFQGGAIGALTYDFGWRLEDRAPPVALAGDEIFLAFYDTVLAFDHETRRAWLIASGHPETDAPGRAKRAARRRAEIEARLAGPARATRPVPPIAWTADVTPADHAAAVERVQAYIRAGDIYQANIAQRFRAVAPRGVDPLDIYAALRAANPAPFAAYLDGGSRHILSTSPELFLRGDAAGVETRPIKGTARRLDDATADAAVAARLLASRKDQAENVMIVDLLRNDLSRVCTAESVEVPVLCGLETYAGLHHLVSAVTGRLAPGRDTLDLLAATFPGGSITGAPKLRAMEIIAEIERVPRGIYCGAIGAIGFDGHFCFNIAIRTIVLEDGHLDLRAGGGITILSDPAAEYEETLTKARRLFAAFRPALAEAGA